MEEKDIDKRCIYICACTDENPPGGGGGVGTQFTHILGQTGVPL